LWRTWRNFAKLLGESDNFGDFGKILAKFPNLCKLAKHREAYRVGESGDLGDCGKYGKILPNCQTHANKLNTERPTVLANLTKLAILANVMNMTKFRHIAKRMQIS